MLGRVSFAAMIVIIGLGITACNSGSQQLNPAGGQVVQPASQSSIHSALTEFKWLTAEAKIPAGERVT